MVVFDPTPKQKIWLRQKGDRNSTDVEYLNGEWGIRMYTPTEWKFYPVPEDEYLVMFQMGGHSIYYHDGVRSFVRTKQELG